MIIVLLMMNLHAKSYIFGMLCFCVKLMKNEVVVVELSMSSLLDVVVVVMECVVDELMDW